MAELAVFGCCDLNADEFDGRGRRVNGMENESPRNVCLEGVKRKDGQKKTPARNLPVLNFDELCGVYGAGKATGASDNVAR